jgi:hypothetical protein
VALLRLRHQLVLRRRRQETTLLVEEATAIAWPGGGEEPLLGLDALRLLALPPADDPPRHVREREAVRAVGMIEERQPDLEAFAAERAQALLQDHTRVREASRASGGATVQALPRPDVIGVYVLLPRVG